MIALLLAALLAAPSAGISASSAGLSGRASSATFSAGGGGLSGSGGVHSDPLFAFRPDARGILEPGATTSARASDATNITKINGAYVLSTVGSGVLRVADHPAMGKGFWGEPGATNELLEAVTFDVGATWPPTNASVNADESAGPDGLTTADGIVANLGSSAHGLQQAVTLVGSGNHALSIFAKAGDVDWMWLGYSGNPAVYFDIANGAVGSTSGVIVAKGMSGPYLNGFYHCWVIASVSGAKTIQVLGADADGSNSYLGVGAGVTDLTVSRGQIELGSVPTSAILTTVSAARLADSLRYTESNPAQGSMVAEVTVAGGDSTTIAAFGDSTNDRITLFAEITDAPRITISVASVIQAAINAITDIRTLSPHAVAVTWAVNEFKIFVDGTQESITDTLGTVPSTTTLRIGHNTSGSAELNGIIHNLRVYGEVGIAR